MDLSIQIGRWINKKAKWQAKTRDIWTNGLYFSSSFFLFLNFCSYTIWNLLRRTDIMKGMESREWIEKYIHHRFLSFTLDEKEKKRQKAHENTIYIDGDRLQKEKGKCSLKDTKNACEVILRGWRTANTVRMKISKCIYRRKMLWEYWVG